jgi:hypothetical protein
MHRVRPIVIVLVASAFGCQSGLRPVSSATQSDEVGDPEQDLDYTSHQGRMLLGFTDPTVSYFVVENPQVTHLQVEKDGRLTSDQMKGEDFRDATVSAITAGGPIKMHIVAVEAPQSSGGQWHYMLEQANPTTGEWEPACANPPQLYGGTFSSAKLRAIAMPGSWSTDGIYTKDPQRFTFACATGVAAKCTAWSYAALIDRAGTTRTGAWRQSPGADLMAACTKMARADYCGSGVPHTIDGTPIHLYDIWDGPMHPQQSVPGFLFEAAWTGRAQLDRITPSSRPALCLSKLRWATLPLGGECPAVLPDPRLPKSEARFCEDYSETELEAAGALFYDDSPLIDVGLYSWRDGSNTWTTSQLEPARPPDPPARKAGFDPPAGVALPEINPQFEGALFRIELAPLPPDTTLLISYYCPDDPLAPGAGGDEVTTTMQAPPQAGCVAIAKEGYLYAPTTTLPPNTPNRVPLQRWYKKIPNPNPALPALIRSWTTTIDAATMTAQGWSWAALEGYLPR